MSAHIIRRELESAECYVISSLKRYAGVLWITLATFSYAVMAAFTKAVIGAVDVYAVVLWRSVVVLVLVAGFARLSGGTLRPRNLKLMTVRSVTGLVALFAYFWSLSQIPLGVATTLLQTAPLFTVLLSGRLLKERTSRAVLPLTIVAFGGVGLIAWPDADISWTPEVLLGLGAALGAGCLAALAYLSVRKLRETDSTEAIVVYFAAFSAVVSAPLGWSSAIPPGGKELGCLLAVGLFAGVGQLAMTRAYRVEKAAIVGPLSYSQIIFSFGLGFFFFGELLTPSLIAGAGLVMVAGALISRQANAARSQSLEGLPHLSGASPQEPRADDGDYRDAKQQE